MLPTPGGALIQTGNCVREAVQRPSNGRVPVRHEDRDRIEVLEVLGQKITSAVGRGIAVLRGDKAEARSMTERGVISPFRRALILVTAGVLLAGCVAGPVEGTSPAVVPTSTHLLTPVAAITPSPFPEIEAIESSQSMQILPIVNPPPRFSTDPAGDFTVQTEHLVYRRGDVVSFYSQDYVAGEGESIRIRYDIELDFADTVLDSCPPPADGQPTLPLLNEESMIMVTIAMTMTQIADGVEMEVPISGSSSFVTFGCNGGVPSFTGLPGIPVESLPQFIMGVWVYGGEVRVTVTERIGTEPLSNMDA